MGRRRAKNAQRFFYDGYLQVADDTGNSYTWDCTETIATRPLAWFNSALDTSHSALYYAHDGNKNVSEVIAADCSLAAHYDYAPFGVPTISCGTSAVANHWRFSSEYIDDETEMFHYNHLHYEPKCGRWLGRDSIDAEGGVNLYLFCLNRSEDVVDVIGRAYFALRPLRGVWWLPIMSHNPLDDYLNTEISHEQLFFEDGNSPSNVGYFDDSTVKSSEYASDWYHVTRTGYNDCVMRKAVAEVRPKPYSLLGLGIGVEKYNCQDYAEELRDAYNRLIE